MSNVRLIDIHAVLLKIPFSKVHIYRLIRENSFPKPVKIGTSRVAWIEEEIDAWMSSRISQRDNGNRE